MRRQTYSLNQFAAYFSYTQKVAILGMTFKPNNDDTRESLSFKIKKELEFKMAEVLCVDPYIKDTVICDEALKLADGLILGVPHQEFMKLKITKPFVDCWDVWKEENLK